MSIVTSEQTTGVQQVTKPNDYDDLKQHVSVTSPSTILQNQQVVQPLPSGWIEIKDPEGRPLYVNTTTGQSSWQRPALQALPPGWQKMQSPEGKDMYIHLGSGTVSYEKPGVPQSPPPAVSGRPSESKVTRVVVQRPKVENKLPVANVTSQQTVLRKGLPRSMTAPVTGRATFNVNVDVGGLQNIPGMHQARIVHQLSENNNVQVLSKKLVSDVAQTSITAASLATRQAKTVGKMLVSPKKLQKFSKRVVVQTGAMSVKAGRACKVVMNEMVDTADGKGKYAQKKDHRPYMAFSAEASLNTVDGGTHQQSSPQASTQATTPVTASSNPQASIKLSMKTSVPARKPIRKPVASATPVVQSEVVSANQQVVSDHHNQALQPHTSLGKPTVEAKPTVPTASTATGNTSDVQAHAPASSVTPATTVQTVIEATETTAPAGQPSSLPPPPYQQAAHHDNTVQQESKIHSDSETVQFVVKPNNPEQKITIDAQSILNAANHLQAVNHEKPTHNSHVTLSNQQPTTHDMIISSMQSGQPIGQQADYVQGQINVISNPGITYLQPQTVNQQDEVVTVVAQPGYYTQNAIAAQQSSTNQVYAYQQTSMVDATLMSTTASQPTGIQQGVIYDQVTYVDTGDVTVTEEEIVYVDENGNILSEDILTFVDETTGEIYTYEASNIDGVEFEVEPGDIGDIDDFEIEC